MRRLVDAFRKPRHSSIALLVILGIALFVTYFLFIPGIVRLYKSELESEQQKLRDVIHRIELHQRELDRVSRELMEVQVLGKDNNRILKEIHSVVKPKATDNVSPHSSPYRPKD
jgi:hypothetical protein